MERRKLWFCSCALRVALVLAMAELLGFAQNVDVQTQIADSLFCERFAVPYGYNCRQYMTITADGFLLAAHRISNKPRTTSKSESTTIGESPTPMPPLCVTSAEQPFESIPDFVRKSDTPESSRTPGISCIPIAPTPLTGSNVQEFAPTPTQPLSAGRGEGLEDLGEKHEPDTGGPSIHPPAASTAYSFVHSSTRHGRIGYVQGLRTSYKRPMESETTGIESSSPSITDTKGDHGLRNAGPSHPSITALSSLDATTAQQSMTDESLDEVAPLPEPQPVPQAEPEEDEDLTPATRPESQSPPSPSSSRGVPLAGSAEPVLLMHHEFHNGKSWFIHADEDSDQLLPFLLLNAGFDVWVGHQRATYYAHEHMTLTPEDQSYWNWTWDEHAKYDMPALLELVKKETGSTVHFVGISQSATAGAAAATIFSVSPLLRSLTLIGPTIYRGNTTSRTLTAFGALLGVNIGNNFYHTETQDGVFNLTSESNSILSILPPVSALLTDISGPNCCLGSNFKVKFGNGWDGTTSLKNVMHYQQGIRTNTWSHFDYGSVMNNSLAYNGSPLPPIYDPDDIPVTLPVLVIYGGRDNIAPQGGVRQFMSHLSSSPSSNNSAALLLPEYAHFDLLYSVNRTQDVFIPVLQFLERQRTLYNDTLQPHSVPN